MTDTLSLTRIEAARDELYALLPEHIRGVDAQNGWALRALIEVLAVGGLEIDDQIDTLYDAMFVETAPEGALADLAALVAAEPLRPLPAGSGLSARAFIANTVRYRRGKGTARALEALAADVGGFGTVVVEYFMRLSRLQNLIDVRAERPAFARLTPGETASRVGTGFDRLPRLLDVRSIVRAGGRHHHQHVGVHLLRPVAPQFAAPTEPVLTPAVMAGVPLARPWPSGVVQHPGYFQLSAHPGRALRLFNPDRRADDDRERVAESELRDRLRRLPLHLETEELRQAALEGRPADVARLPWFNAAGAPFTIFLRRVGAANFDRVPPERVRIANLEAFPVPAAARPAATRDHRWFTAGSPGPVSQTGSSPIACGFDPVTGRLIVSSPAPGSDVEEVRVSYATGLGREIGAGPQERNTADVPFDITDTTDLINMVWVVDPAQPAGILGPNTRSTPTLAMALSEWDAAPAGRRGLIVLASCDREGPVLPALNIPASVHPGSELHIVAAQWRPKRVSPGVPDNPNRRGYIVRRDRRFVIDGRLRVSATAAPPPGGRPGILVLDGLEVTGGVTLAVRALSGLHIRHCTVRAPGGPALNTTAVLEGPEIVIDRSIVGRIVLDFGSGPGTGDLVISDSLISVDEAAGDAIAAATLDGRLSNVTVLGASKFKSLEATNVIFTGVSTVTRSQDGCVRYSSIAEGSAMPRRFRCQPDLAIAAATEKKATPLTSLERGTAVTGVLPLFLDTGLDEPTVAMLSPMTADAIRLGGEGETEMGVFSAAAEGLRMANLTSLFDDFVPFGLEAGLIDDTRSSAVATRRNRP